MSVERIEGVMLGGVSSPSLNIAGESIPDWVREALIPILTDKNPLSLNRPIAELHGEIPCTVYSLNTLKHTVRARGTPAERLALQWFDNNISIRVATLYIPHGREQAA